MYKIIGADRREYGPITSEQLKQWIAEGRVNGQTQAQPEGSAQWLSLGSLPEFAEALAAKSPPPVDPGAFDTDQAVNTLPEDLLQRDYDVSIGDYLSRSIELLKSKFGLVFGGAAIFIGIQFLLGLMGSIPLLGSLISLGSMALYGPLVGGLYFFLLLLIRNQPARIDDVFSGFRRTPLQLILCYIVILVLTAVACVPGVALMAGGIIPQIARQEFVPMFTMLAAAGLVLVLVVIAYITVIWMFALPLVIDQGMEFWAAMETSRKVVSKHWWKMFALLIVTMLVVSLGVLVCFVGIFFTLPVAFGTLMYAYEDIFCRRAAQSA